MVKCLLFLLLDLMLTFQTDYREKRAEMVQQQLRGRDIDNPSVLAAMMEVERHRFVPDEIKGLAYEDRPLPIGYSQTISQPYIVAFMTQALNPEPDDKILEIGTGSGYQAAVLAEIVDSVYTIEILPELGKISQQVFQKLGYENIMTKIGDGYKGWPQHAPFDGIVVTAAPEQIPPPLKAQLKEGGRMIIPVGPKNNIQQLQVIEKENGKLKKRTVMSVRFVPFTREPD